MNMLHFRYNSAYFNKSKQHNLNTESTFFNYNFSRNFTFKIKKTNFEKIIRKYYKKQWLSSEYNKLKISYEYNKLKLIPYKHNYFDIVVLNINSAITSFNNFMKSKDLKLYVILLKIVVCSIVVISLIIVQCVILIYECSL